MNGTVERSLPWRGMPGERLAGKRVIARTVSGTVVDGTLMDPAETGWRLVERGTGLTIGWPHTDSSVGWDADWRWSDVQVLEA